MLGVLDYIVFVFTLVVSFGISFYFGCFGSKQKTAAEYLYGNGKFRAIPIGLSLLASGVSANPIIGTVAEVYVFGSQYLAVTLAALISMLLASIFIIPIFCGNLKLKAPYEYFELRYTAKVRLILSVIYVFQIIVNCSFVLYVSAMTFSEFSGLPLYLCSIVIGSICTAYTVLGGFAGVIWTDVLQLFLMAFSLLFTLYVGVNTAGGIKKVWTEAEEGQRLQFFNMDPNPFIRTTFWGAGIAFSILNIAHGACASSGIQRFMALHNQKEARISLAILTCGVIFTTWTSGLIGLTIYAIYKNCDPIMSKKIGNPTQLLVYFISDLPVYRSGFRGIFTAGILSAGLSSLSAEMNAVSGLIYYDILQKYFKVTHHELKATLIMKAIILILGTIFIVLSPFIQHFKYFLQMSLSIASWTYGMKVGVMILATAIPMSNSWGAIAGMASGILTVGWISLHAMYYDLASEYMLPLSTKNCSNIIINNFTTIISNITEVSAPAQQQNIPIIYQLSYLYYGLLGMIITILIGVLVSYITGPNDVNKMDPRLIIPCLRPAHHNNNALRQGQSNPEEMKPWLQGPRL